MSDTTTTKSARVSSETFVQTWVKANSRQEVATTLGMKLNAVISREQSYRKAGVPLKKMKRVSSRPRLNIDALTKLCLQQDVVANQDVATDQNVVTNPTS
jgi:hypothetical protein